MLRVLALELRRTAVTFSHVMAMHAKILKLIVTALSVSCLFLGPVQAQSTEGELLEQLREAPESGTKRLER